MKEDENKSHNIFLYILLGGCLIAILSSFYFFYYKKNFDFLIEVPCDITKEQCFQRDCTNPDNCPPNELSDFKRYSLKARDFKYCKDEDCTSVCESGEVKCTLIACKDNLDAGESCSPIPDTQTE